MVETNLSMPWVFPILDLLRSSEFWAAIVGAMVGGLIAYLVQIKALREARRDRAEERLLAQKGLANSLMLGMVRIYSNIRTVHEHIEQCIERTEKTLLVGNLWQFVSPLANPPPPVYFTSDELGMLLGLKDNEVFNSVVSMDQIHNGLLDTMRAYTIHRQRLAERLPPAASVEGSRLTSYLTKEQRLALAPYLIDTNSLVEQLQSQAAEGVQDAQKALESLQHLLRNRLGLMTSFQFNPSRGATKTQKAQPNPAH